MSLADENRRAQIRAGEDAVTAHLRELGLVCDEPTTASPASDKPLSCPHCGAEPMMYDIEPHEHAMTFGSFKMPDHPGSAVIECGCGAGMIDATKEAVLARWNRRS